MQHRPVVQVVVVMSVVVGAVVMVLVTLSKRKTNTRFRTDHATPRRLGAYFYWTNIGPGSGYFKSADCRKP